MNQKEFKIYDKTNPEVWDMFEKFALQATKKTKRIASRFITDRIRWESMVKTKGKYKVHDHASKFYAKKFINKYPEHSGFFTTRK